MADKIDISLKLETYSEEMRKLSLKQDALEKEIKELEKEKAGKYGRFGKDIGKISDPQKAEEIKKERLSAENKKLEKLQKELDELEKKQIVQRNKLLEQEIDEKKSEIKERERVFKKKQEEKYSAYTFSQAEYEKKISAQEEELIKKQEELVKLKTEINNKRKKDLDEQIKQTRKQAATAKKTHSAYEGYSFEPLVKSDLEEIQKDIKSGVLKTEQQLLKRLPKGRTIPLEEMRLFEGKKSTGGRAHDYLEAGTTKEKYGDLFKDIRTISITQSGKILFGDKYPTKEERQGYIEKFKKEKQTLMDSVPKNASYAQLISVNSKIRSLEEQIAEQEAEIKKLNDGTYTAQGTAFHSFAEMFGRGKLPLLKDLLKSGSEKEITQAKDIISKYFKVSSVDDLMALKDTGFTDNDREIAEEFFDKLQSYRGIVGSNRATSYMTSGLKSYEDFLTKHGISEAEAVEKSIGFITNIDDELVKFVGTIDALFSNFLIDLKTGKLHPAEVAWQTNLGAFIEEMVSGVKHEKLGAFKPGSTYEDSFFLPISKMPPKLIKQLLVEVARGQRTTENIEKYAQGTFEQRMVKGKDDKDVLATFINKKRLPSSTYETEKPKTQSGIDKIQREAEELVDSIKSLKVDDIEHVLNQIYSTTDYTSKTSKLGSSFYRSGYFWDTVREKLPYDISKVLNYAMGAEESVLPKSSGVGTRTYRIQDDDQIQEIDVPTVLGVTLKEWAKLANTLSEMPDGAEKVKRLVDLFEKEFKGFNQDDQRRILKSFQNMATSDDFLPKEYSKLLKDKKYLETQLSIYKDSEKSEKLKTELTEIQQKISEFEKNGAFNPYETFEKAWEESSDFLSRKNKQFLLETLDDYRSVKYETTDNGTRGKYTPEVDPYEEMYEEDDFHYKGGEVVGKSPDEKAELLGNQLARIFDYSTRVDKIFAAKAREMGVPVEDLSKSVLRDFAETTGSQDEFNRYVRSKELQQSFQAQFPNFKGKIEGDVLDWILSKLDENISEEKKVLSGWADILEEGPVTRGKLRNGKIVSKKTIIPSQELKDVAGRRIFNTLYSDKENAALEVMDDLLHGKTHEFTKTAKPNIEWASAFLNYDELLPDANNILEQYVSARAELEAATKEFNFQNLSKSNVGSTDWEKAQEALEKAKTKVQDILTLSRKTFKSGLVPGYDQKDITKYLQEKEAEAAEEKRQQYISSAAMWAYRGADPSKTKLSQQEIEEYLKFNAEQFGISTEDLLGEYRKENVYTPFYEFLKNKAGKEGVKFQTFSPKKIAQTIVDTAAPVVSDAVVPVVSQAVEDMVVVGIPEAVSDITAEQLPPEQIQKEVKKAVSNKTKKKTAKNETVTITPQPIAAKKKKPKRKTIIGQVQNTGGIQSVYATSDDIADLSKTKATSITTDYEGHTIGKTYKYLADKIFANYGPGGLAGWIDKARQQGIDASKTELIDILTKVPSYKKASGGLSKAGRTAFDEIMADAFGDKYQPQSGSGAILNELKGIHKDTSSIEVKVGLGGAGAPSTMAAVMPTGTTSQTTSRTTSIKPTDKVKKYLEYSKTISDLRVKQRKEESSFGKNQYEVMIEAYQKLQKDLGDFTDKEKLLIQEKEKEIEQNQKLKLSEVEIAAAKKQTKQEAKDAAQAEKDRVKSEKDAATQTAKTAREYQRYLDQRFSILSKIESAQAQYNISTGKERIAAEGVITQRKIELDYLDQKNSDLIETMANTQKATKADLDYAQSLRVASMQQEKLLSKKGAKSLWDVMGNDIKRAAMRVTDFGLAAKLMNKLPQDLQKIVQYTKELDKAMTNVRIVGGYTAEQAKVLTARYTELGRTLGATTTEIAEGMDTWLRQGYEAQDQLESLVSASTKLSKLGMISASEATTALTSALKAFNLAAEDAIKVVDKLTKVDQLAAVSAGGISEALQKSATSAKLAGMSMDELIGSVSVIGEVTQQSMDTVGNAMKSILARYGNVKASVFTQMGLNDEGETSENINDIEKVLSKLGIRMRSSSTELRDITDVLDEVNEKWDTYDTVTKNALATAFGGTRMRENFLVLMENWSRVKELTEESANAAGTADEKYTAYMDSIEAATKRLQNAWESMSQKFESSWLIKLGTNALAGFIGHFDTLIKLVATFASVKFSDQIFGFTKSTVLGAPKFFKKLLGFGDNRQRQITYDANGNPIINPVASGAESTLAKLQSGTTQAVQTSNSLLQQILAQLKTNGSGIVNPEYDASGKITNGLAINGRRVVVKTTKSGKSAYYYENGGMVRSSANIQKLNAQQAAITKYNAQIGTTAAQNQISGYTGRTWGGYAKQVNIGDRAYYRLKDGPYVTETGEVLPANQQKNVDEINKQLRADKISQRTKQGVTAGLTVALSELMTTKEVGTGIGGTLGKLFTGNKDNEQTIEETAGGKALRTALTGGLSGVLGAYFGPLGAMVGQIAGEGISGIISTIVHRSELEMKQRVVDAKENLSKLSEVQSSIDENSSVMRKEVLESGDEKQLEKYVDTIRDFFIDNTDFISSFLEKFGGEYSSVSAVLKDINSEDVDFRSKVEKYFEETVSELKTSNTLASQEEDRAKIAELYGLDIQGVTLEEKLASAKQTVRELKDAGYTKGPIEYYESIVQKLEKAIIQEEKLNKEWLESAAQEGYLRSGIKKLSKTDLTKLGLEGAINAIADQMEQQGIGVRTDGKIHEDVYNIIRTAIKEDTEISSALERGSLTIGEYIQDSTTYADRIKQFALAFNITEEEAIKMGKTFKDLTIELGNMTPSDVLEYYQKFSDVLSEVTSSGGLTAKTLNTIIKELPRLTPYIFQGADALESEIYKAILGGEMDFVYENALNSQIFSNEGVFEYFKTQYSNLSKAAKEETTLLGLKGLIELGEATEEDKKAYYDFISNKEVEYQKDLTVQNQLREYQISLMNDEVNNLEEQKSALSDINEQRKKEIDYIKAKNALEDARKEKKRVFRSGIGWSYEVDEAAISEAKEKVDSLQVERDQEAIQYQIDAINAQKAFLEALPDQAQNERLKTLMDEFTKGDNSMLERVKKLSDAFADATEKMGLKEPSKDNNKDNNTIEAETTPTSAIEARVSGLGGAILDKLALDNPFDHRDKGKIDEALGDLGYSDKGYLGYDLFELTYGGKKYTAGSYNYGVTDISLIKNLNKSYGEGTPIRGEVIYYEDPNGKATGLYTYNNKNDWRKVVLFDGLSDDDPLKQYVPNASGTTSFPGGQTLINELGTEAVITPGGTLTALPSKTGIVPADITRNVWALGEVAPTLIARLGSLTQKPLAGNGANTTYEEGQYIDNLTMNVYPAKGDDFNKILEQARAQVRLTRRNN